MSYYYVQKPKKDLLDPIRSFIRAIITYGGIIAFVILLIRLIYLITVITG